MYVKAQILDDIHAHFSASEIGSKFQASSDPMSVPNPISPMVSKVKPQVVRWVLSCPSNRFPLEDIFFEQIWVPPVPPNFI